MALCSHTSIEVARRAASMRGSVVRYPSPEHYDPDHRTGDCAIHWNGPWPSARCANVSADLRVGDRVRAAAFAHNVAVPTQRVCFADDILLASSSKEDLERMISDRADAFADVGLEVGADET
eukprot:12793683-Alexandrium_andersonii.AAC.1